MSDSVTVNVPVSLVQGAQPPTPTPVQASGNTLPLSGKSATPSAATPAAAPAHANAATQNANSVTQKAATNPVSVPALVALLNKYLNDSGRPNQYRVDPTSGGQTIQEINPSNGAVIGEFSVAEFPALARSLGVSGVLVDSHA
jgi:hypothetical protein